MILYINERREIKDVGVTEQVGLTALIIPEEDNPFKGWPIARIVCYKVILDRNGDLCGYTPYVDSRIVEQLAHLDADKQLQIDDANSDISDNREGLIETFDTTITNSGDIADCREAIIELYDMILGGE